MSLNELALFKNVKITPDYSVVHDMDPDTWKKYLMGELWESNPEWNTDSPEILFSQNVNYYRMPETIRVEGNFDLIRQATYGFLHDPAGVTNPSFGTVFFFVNDVRLLKQHSNQVTEGEDATVVDVCELDISIDVWSSYGGKFELYDSYVERRHMPRWKNEGTEQVPDWKPIYYPNAAQGVDGAYEPETEEPLVKPKTLNTPLIGPENIDINIGIMSVLDKDGNLSVLAFLEGQSNVLDHGYKRTLWVGSNNVFKPCFAPSQLVSDDVYTAIGVDADYIQSFCVVKGWQDLTDGLSLHNDQIVINTGSLGYQETFVIGNFEYVYFILANKDHSTSNLGEFTVLRESDVTPVAPDHDAQPEDGEYLDAHEPMMYMGPARARKVTAPLGGELFEIPDIVAFADKFYSRFLLDITNLSQMIGVYQSHIDSNAIGATGVIESATMPIYNSAWKSYEAISKVSDTMMFNAKQMQTVGTGLGGSALSAAGGFMMGGPGGAVLGLASGILGTVSGVYGNDVELEAKRVQIKNSPCNVKSTGSGYTNISWGLLDAHYVTLKMDDQSMEKLRFMYYWFGYHVNRTFKGDIDLHTRTKFDFIKTSRAKVKGDLTAGAAKQIGAIFDAGVTIYHGPEGYALIGTGDMVSNDEVE